MIDNTSQRSAARPLVFNNKQEIHNFVHANNSQAFSVSMPMNYQKINPNYTPQTSLFDRYNRQNLLLKDCDPKDLTILNKNVIMHQQALSAQFIEQIGQIIKKSPQKIVYKTSQNFYQQKIDKKHADQKPSREYIQNEIFFNYKQMGEIKKKKKQQFLSEIQNRIAEAQREIVELQQIQDQQKIQMQELGQFQAKVGTQLTKNYEAGLIKTQVGKAIGFQTQQLKQVFHIHPQMKSNQINQILEDHFKLNDDILQMANNARVRSKEKINEKPQFTKTSFNNTLLLGKNAHKNMISTSKTNKFPKKPVKK